MVKQRIVDNKLEFYDIPWSTMPEAKALVSKLLVYEPIERATVWSALKSPWITCDLEDLERAYYDRVERADIER
jgi:serine/threonine protein kinase